MPSDLQSAYTGEARNVKGRFEGALAVMRVAGYRDYTIGRAISLIDAVCERIGLRIPVGVGAVLCPAALGWMLPRVAPLAGPLESERPAGSRVA